MPTLKQQKLKKTNPMFVGPKQQEARVSEIRNKKFVIQETCNYNCPEKTNSNDFSFFVEVANDKKEKEL